MSLSGALNAAVSGLTATARSAGLVSNNVSNALTESYGRRELHLSSNPLMDAGGVRIDGIIRHVNPVVLGDRRLADADVSLAETELAFSSRLEAAFGDPTSDGSLAGRVTALQSALVLAASNPASSLRLNEVSTTANALVGKFNEIGNAIQQERMRADERIAAHVTTLNDALQQVQELNASISTAVHVGRDPSALQDQRQRVIDTIAQLVPVRVVPRDRNAVAIITTRGGVLLDGRAAEIGFSESGVIAPHMTFENGLLSGITINGRAIPISEGGPLSGGSLGAELAIRDRHAVELQEKLDGVARDLIERFGPGGPDITLAPGALGLFTDQGTVFDPANETGLALRIRLNELVAPDQEGIWRLRDGLGTGVEGDVGNASLLNGLKDQLASQLAPASTSLDSRARSFAGLATQITSGVAYDRVQAERVVGFATAERNALHELELSEGVDTDLELQALMRIEQAYQANARVITVIDDLMKTILNI